MSSEIPEVPIPNSYWVVPGRFLAGEYPGDASPELTRARLAAFRASGIDFFVDLTEAYDLAPYAPELARADETGHAPAHCRMPIVDFGVPTVKEMASILDAIDDALAAGRRAYVHCWGGVGRTGMVAGCWLVRHGRSGSDALDDVMRLFRTMEKAALRPGSPETPEQRAFVAGWAEPPEESSARTARQKG